MAYLRVAGPITQAEDFFRLESRADQGGDLPLTRVACPPTERPIEAFTHLAMLLQTNLFVWIICSLPK